MFEQVVFAGGGHRCWWQAGFWDAVAQRIGLRPRVIAGVSAGAATACLLYASDSRTALDWYHEVLRGSPRNLYPGNLFRPGQRVFPHARIYRQALRALLGGEGFNRLRDQAPEIRVQYTRLPRWLALPVLGPYGAVAVGFSAYLIEKHALKPLHPVAGRRLGFRSETARVGDCESIDDLVSLLVASSCTPPFTPIEHRGGRPALDGGLVDNVPVDALDPAPPGTVLVLTTRRYPGRPDVFQHEGRVYAQPSVKVPVSSWDYTAPADYERTWALGRHDGEAFLRALPTLHLAAGETAAIPIGMAITMSITKFNAREE